MKSHARNIHASSKRQSVSMSLGPIAALVAMPAEAHGGTGLPGGLVAGIEHPFTGADHLLAMVAVGIWGAYLGRPLIYALPVLFPLMMVGGAVLGMFGLPMPRVELGIAFSVLVLGLCIALSIRAPAWVACLVVGAFALLHGYAHGRELPSAADPVGYSTGFVLATGLLHVSGIGIGLFRDRPGGDRATRTVGAAIAALGAWFLWRAMHA